MKWGTCSVRHPFERRTCESLTALPFDDFEMGLSSSYSVVQARKWKLNISTRAAQVHRLAEQVDLRRAERFLIASPHQVGYYPHGRMVNRGRGGATICDCRRCRGVSMLKGTVSLSLPGRDFVRGLNGEESLMCRGPSCIQFSSPAATVLL